jgi:hypothetical protein
VPKSTQTRFVGIITSTITYYMYIPTLAFLDYYAPVDVDSHTAQCRSLGVCALQSSSFFLPWSRDFQPIRYLEKFALNRVLHT